MVQKISGWIGEVNPGYNNPFIPNSSNPYRVNCGSCAFAVEARLDGNTAAVASQNNIGTDAEMEARTGKSCKYMQPQDIEKILRERGPGSHLIAGINRQLPTGQRVSGHWFNVVFDGEKIYTVDGQSGEIYDWPHDYGNVSEWCALV